MTRAKTIGRRGPVETDVLFAVRRALAESGRVMLWRNNTGFDQDRKIHYGLGLGGADLVGMLKPSGRFAAFEVKTESGRVSKEQEQWHAAVRAAGGFVAVVRSPEDALDALSRAESGASS